MVAMDWTEKKTFHGRQWVWASDPLASEGFTDGVISGRYSAVDIYRAGRQCQSTVGRLLR